MTAPHNTLMNLKAFSSSTFFSADVAVETPTMNKLEAFVGKDARMPPSSIVPSSRAWGLNQVTAKQAKAMLSSDSSSTTLFREGFDRASLTPMYVTAMHPMSSMSPFKNGNTPSKSPMPKKHASASETSKTKVKSATW